MGVGRAEARPTPGYRVYGAPTDVMQTVRVGVVGEFVLNVAVAVFGPAVAGTNVSVNV